MCFLDSERPSHDLPIPNKTGSWLLVKAYAGVANESVS